MEMGSSLKTNDGWFQRIVAGVAQMCVAALFVLSAFGQSGAILTTLQTGISMSQAPLVQGSDGYFYGTGFTPSQGEVFKVGADGTLTDLHDFSGADGTTPKGGLVQGSDGYLYGVTMHGGTNGGFGTVFKISTNGSFTSLYSFTGGADGGVPETPLVAGGDGYFYGTTDEGGAITNSGGTVFKISADGSLTTLYSFTGGSDGSNPGGLVQGRDGYFYGTTYFDADWASYGTVFRISATGTLTTLYTFTRGSDGENPSSAAWMVQGPDGYLYGTTMFGGAAGQGTVFKISTNGSLTTLHSFTGGSDGGVGPFSAMMQSSDGYVYGVTYSSIFRVSAAGTLSTLYSFTGAGVNGLVQGSDGYFYGTTFNDFNNNNGRFFRLTVLPVLQPLTRTNDALTLTWSTEPGWKYQLMYSSDLSSGTWTGMGDISTASGPTLTATDSVTNAPQRFYRVALSQ
jgi:uncharacterized repeat protein (TIGR03803 family)